MVIWLNAGLGTATKQSQSGQGGKLGAFAIANRAGPEMLPIEKWKKAVLPWWRPYSLHSSAVVISVPGGQFGVGIIWNLPEREKYWM